jgi:hypothetical protein
MLMCFTSDLTAALSLNSTVENTTKKSSGRYGCTENPFLGIPSWVTRASWTNAQDTAGLPPPTDMTHIKAETPLQLLNRWQAVHHTQQR